jgi:hypothetical protein
MGRGPARANNDAVVKIAPTAPELKLACAQCGRPLPHDDREIARWKHGYLAGEFDEVSQGILLCPACAAEDAFGEFDAGVAD